MRYIKTIVGGAIVLWAVVSMAQFMLNEENSIRLDSNWGIAKDNPIRR